MTEQQFIASPCVVQRLDVLTRDNKQVDRSLRIHVAENDRVRVRVNNVGGDFARDDATKDTVLLGHALPEKK